MAYSDFEALDAYRAAHAGVAIRVALVREENPADVIAGRLNSFNPNNNFEQIPVPELGEPVKKEIATGAHDGGFSLSLAWSPEAGDKAPSSQSFINKGYYTIFLFVGAGRPGEGEIVSVFIGAKFSNESSPLGAGGIRTMNLSGLYLQAYTGEEWAAISPS